MSKTVSIPVPNGLTGHGEIVKNVVLREPTYDEFLEYGEPTVLTKAPNGAIFAVEDADVIKNYITACIVEPKDPLLLPQGGLRLARDVKEAILGFFRDESTVAASSTTSQTNSSSGSASAPGTSAA